jgi:hypothetical protein
VLGCRAASLSGSSSGSGVGCSMSAVMLWLCVVWAKEGATHALHMNLAAALSYNCAVDSAARCCG